MALPCPPPIISATNQRRAVCVIKYNDIIIIEWAKKKLNVGIIT